MYSSRAPFADWRHFFLEVVGLFVLTTLLTGCANSDRTFDDTPFQRDAGADGSAGGAGSAGAAGAAGAGGASGHAGAGGGAGAAGQGGAEGCDGVRCDQPPPSRCFDDATRESFAGVGTCSEGQCHYPSTREPCTFGCTDGGCKGDPCLNLACDTPPVSECLDGSTRRSYEGGRCVTGACQFDHVDFTCQFGCENGQCRGNPCEGVGCSSPPLPYCVTATTLRSYAGTGTCSEGSCSYPQTDTACQFGCEAGACKPNPCEGVTCTSPEPPSCQDATTRRSYASPGSCIVGNCSYTPTLTPCPFGCEAGACKPNPCEGVSCTTPPSAVCLDAVTRRSFSSSGACSDGACSYAPTVTTCSYGCTGGACNPDPCEGVSCTAPPSAVCLDAVTRRSFSSPGTCGGGMCSYGSTSTTCPFGCAAGSCNPDPCEGVSCTTPPSAVCVNATTRRTFSSTGSCSGGGCSYTPSDVSCQYGCLNGQCQNQPDPCAGVTCTTPPPNSCPNANTRRVYSSTGSCSNGQCSYTHVDALCAYGCTNGTCNPNPCSGVSCTSPPASTCLNPSTRRSFANPGTCSGGVCSYAPTDTPCPFGCTGGACNPDPCSGVTCNTPPPKSCKSLTELRTYSSPGTCSGGNCSYSFTDTVCPFGCANSACNPDPDPCGGVTCTTPPAAVCTDTFTRRSYSSPGVCSGGLCSYSFTDTSCSPMECVNGACRPACPVALSIGAFSSGSDGWSFDGLWRYSGGAMVAGSGLKYNTSYTQLLTQGSTVDLSGCSGATLKFSVKLSDDDGYSNDPTDMSERLYVECSGDGGVSWATPLTPNPAPANQNGCGNSYCAGKEGYSRSFNWTAQSIALPATCLTSTAKFRFRAQGRSAWRLYDPGWYVKGVTLN